VEAACRGWCQLVMRVLGWQRVPNCRSGGSCRTCPQAVNWRSSCGPWRGNSSGDTRRHCCKPCRPCSCRRPPRIWSGHRAEPLVLTLLSPSAGVPLEGEVVLPGLCALGESSFLISAAIDCRSRAESAERSKPLLHLPPPRPAPAPGCAAQAGSIVDTRKAWASAFPQRKSAAGRALDNRGSVHACGDLAHELSFWEKHWKVARSAFSRYGLQTRSHGWLAPGGASS
jgi:hypothetical protein